MKIQQITLLSILFFCSFLLHAQNFSITGQITDAEKSIPIEAATVYLEAVKDSMLITYTISDAKGNFQLLGNTPRKEVKVFISSIGYQSYFKKIKLTNPKIDLGQINLDFAVESLDEVLVQSRAPVTIKKDTLEFNVASFKTKKDANVEDLLKELPGVEVGDDGKIRVNGKEVNKILVNGKPFFGDDPTIATRNLTKDIVDKIQVTDSKTDAEAFAGEEGDGENKTINITIQEDKNKGTFGRVAAGIGTDERYEAAGIINYFNDDQRISVLMGGNNINSPGFSFGEIRKMFGGARSMSVNDSGAFSIDGISFGGGEGIVTSRNAGVNYTDDLNNKINVNANYFYGSTDSENERLSERENILPDTRFFSTSSSNSISKIDNHDVNISFDIKVDSTFLINIKPSLKFITSDSRFQSTDSSRDENGVQLNRSNLFTNSERLDKRFTNDIDVTKRFGNRGAFLKVNTSAGFNNASSDEFLQSNTDIFGDLPETLSRDQFTNTENSFTSWYANITYRHPLISKKVFLDVSYSYRWDVRENLESTFNFNTVTQQYDDFNEDLSTDFRFINTRKTPGAKLVYQGKKLSASVGTGYVFRTLENQDKLRGVEFEQDFDAIELNGRVNYRFSPKASLYTGYQLSNRPPDISQLQPFQDVSNPLNTITGNPNLKPSNEHSVYVGFNDYDFQKRSGFYSYFNIRATNDKVVARTIIDENLVSNTTFDNVNGDYRIYGSLSKSKSYKIDSLRTIKVGLGLYGNINRIVNFNNEIQYRTNTTSLTPNLSFTFTWKNILELRPRYSISFTNTTYDIDLFDNRDFLRHDLWLRTTTFVPKNLEWSNDIKYNYNPDVAAGFQRSSWFWNTTVAYSLWKKKATVTLKIYDLLNQNNNARRIATSNYIEDAESTVLQQYFMLSFSYKFNSLGKKGEVGKDNFFFD